MFTVSKFDVENYTSKFHVMKIFYDNGKAISFMGNLEDCLK